MAKYPRIGQQFKVSRPTECHYCYELAVKIIHWQFDYMRGNDEVYAACEEHLNLAQKNQDKYWCDFRKKNGVGGRINPMEAP